MTALILLAHGSRHPRTKPVLEQLVADVRAAMPATFPDSPSEVRLAWLDLDEPSLGTVCANLAQSGHSRAVAIPLLFTEAYHRRIDVPAQVRDCNSHGIDIAVAEGLGLGEAVQRALVKRIVEAAARAGLTWPVDVLVMAVGSSDHTANSAIEVLAASLDGMLPGHVSAAFVVGPKKVKGPQAVAVARERAAQRGRALIVAPLFTAPGLLWDRVRQCGSGPANGVSGASQVGTVVYAKPLAELLTPVICCRWDSRGGIAQPQELSSV